MFRLNMIRLLISHGLTFHNPDLINDNAFLFSKFALVCKFCFFSTLLMLYQTH